MASTEMMFPRQSLALVPTQSEFGKGANKAEQA